MLEKPRVKAIFISPSQGEPMVSTPSVVALESRGLEGDRYANDEGYWQQVGKKTTRDKAVRDVTLIRAEDIADSDFEEHETRRNIVTEGEVDLISLIGQEFRVGEVILKGTEECAPCKRPSDIAGKEGFAQQFKPDGKGGIRAAVLSWGSLTVGDEVSIAHNTPENL